MTIFARSTLCLNYCVAECGANTWSGSTPPPLANCASTSSLMMWRDPAAYFSLWRVIMDKLNVAVLLDYENIRGRDAIRFLLDLISGIGSIVEKRAYGDWSVQQRKEQDQLLQLGFSLIHQRHST